MAQTSLNSTGVASTGALSLQSNGTTEAIGISTGQVATLAQNPVLTSGTANGVGYLNGSKVLTTGSVLQFDGTNLGLGVTPSAWGSTWKASQIGAVGALASTGSGSTSPTAMVLGAYNDNTNWKYQYSSVGAARYEMTGANAGSTHAWYVAAGGTAGNAITFTQAMTLDASGNLGVGTTSPASKLNVSGGAVFIDNTVTADYLRFRGSAVGLSGGINATSAAAYLGTYTAHPLWITTNNAVVATFDSSGNLIQSAPTTPPSLATNGTMVFNLTSNTNLRVSVRGSDGVTRTANLTLA